VEDANFSASQAVREANETRAALSLMREELLRCIGWWLKVYI
jgi:hypothetical protein